MEKSGQWSRVPRSRLVRSAERRRRSTRRLDRPCRSFYRSEITRIAKTDCHIKFVGRNRSIDLRYNLYSGEKLQRFQDLLFRSVLFDSPSRSCNLTSHF